MTQQNPQLDADRRAAFRRGVREMLPMMPAIAAWGLVTGVAMVQSGLTLAQALGLSALAYAGSAQLAVLPLFAGGSPVWVIVLTAIMVNLRFVIYSAVLYRPLAHLSWRRRLMLGYLTGDIGFVIFSRRLHEEPEWPQRGDYFLGLSSVNWVVWHVASFTGILLAARIPREWGLELAGTLALLALLVPFFARRPAAAGVLVSGSIAVMCYDWPLRLGLVVAIGCGLAAALLVERMLHKAQPGAAT
ncbi:MAG: AzlC family ABC transporter permease [Gammaproteobacteria bacterium]|jgi:predicted branched-subunit amino acid permease|nr:AzlC family ABC transporter permease [Gammaproteobacteria bacterium]